MKTSTQLSKAFCHLTKYFSNIKHNIQQEIKCLLVSSVITDTSFVLWSAYLHYTNQQWLYNTINEILSTAGSALTYQTEYLSDMNRTGSWPCPFGCLS